MSLLIDGGSYRSAADALLKANRSTAELYEMFAGDLDGCGAMAGTDAAGADFAASYDEAAVAALTAYAGLVDAFGSLGVLTQASCTNHLDADRASRLDRYSVPVPVLDQPAHATVRRPPSALGSDGRGPDWWHWVADHVGGLLYPDADVDRLRSAARMWQLEGDGLESFSNRCELAGNILSVNRSPEISDALAAYDDFGHEIRALAQNFRDLGAACADFAGQVEDTRDELESIVAEFIAWSVGIQLGTHLAAAFTFGAAEVPGQAIQAARIAKTAQQVRNALLAFSLAARTRAAAIVLVRTRLLQSSTALARFKVPPIIVNGVRTSRDVRSFAYKLTLAQSKLPRRWGAGRPNSKGVGTRWFAPRKGDGVRIDKGNPDAFWPSQRVDHVIVNRGGSVISGEGTAIKGSIQQNPGAHIPLDDWLTWRDWGRP